MVNESKWKKEFIEFENNPNLLNYKFKKSGLFMYSYIRITLYGEVIIRENVNKNKAKKNNRTLQSKSKYNMLQYMLYAITKSCFRIKNKKIIYMSSQNLCSNKKEGKNYNWLHDPFVRLYPEITAITERYTKYSIEKSRFNGNTFVTDLLLIISKLFSKIVKCEDLQNINELIEEIKKSFPYPIDLEFESKLRNLLIYRSKITPIQTKFWEHVFKKNDTKLLLVHTACYEGFAHIINLARKHGIFVAEMQHGIILENDPPYNYGKCIITNEEYQSHLPDELWIFGEYWKENISNHIKTRVIGYPVDVVGSENESDLPKVLVFCGQPKFWRETVEAILLCIKKKVNDEYKLIYKPHPKENLEGYRDILEKNNVSIITEKHILDVIKEATAVVSAPSSVIFESFLVKKPCIVLDYNEQWKENVGIVVRNEQEFCEMIEQLDNVKCETGDMEKYYSSKWRENYVLAIKELRM